MDRPFANRVGRKDPARARGRGDRRHPLGAQDRRESHQGHGRQQARLGAVAPARMGRAARDLRPQGRARGPLRRGGQRAHRRGLRERGRGRLVCRRRQGAFPRRRSTDADDYDKIDNLVEVWFDSGSTHAFVLEDRAFIFPGSPASGAGRRRPGRGDVSGGLGPASRLVSVFVARKLRHARAGAFRHRADAWLYARREGAEAVEVAR